VFSFYEAATDPIFPPLDLFEFSLQFGCGSQLKLRDDFVCVEIDAHEGDSEDKGVVNGDIAWYEPIGNEGTDFRVLYNAPFRGKSEYSINWATGRYRFKVYALDYSKTIPAAEASGKCELIHSPQPQ
jgi:hypothetical protein